MNINITQLQMACKYSNGHRLVHETVRQCIERGDLELAAAWQMTARGWFQNRADALQITDASLDTFSLGHAGEAHERVNVARGTPGLVHLAAGDVA